MTYYDLLFVYLYMACILSEESFARRVGLLRVACELSDQRGSLLTFVK
jgi:hypothetical protein